MSESKYPCQWCGAHIGFGDCPHCGGPNPLLTEEQDKPIKISLVKLIAAATAYSAAERYARRMFR